MNGWAGEKRYGTLPPILILGSPSWDGTGLWKSKTRFILLLGIILIHCICIFQPSILLIYLRLIIILICTLVKFTAWLKLLSWRHTSTLLAWSKSFNNLCTRINVILAYFIPRHLRKHTKHMFFCYQLNFPWCYVDN